MEEVGIVLFGVGGVGKALLRQIVESRHRILARAGCRFQLLALVDSRSWVTDDAGLTDEQVEQAIMAKQKKQPLGRERRPEGEEIVRWADGDKLRRLIVVDATAAAGMEPALDAALTRGHGVVLANKKPLTTSWEEAQGYFGNRLVRYEATVGGGQPVIATLHYLLDTDDPPERIEGQLSGTFSYICRRLDRGDSFSVALAAARASGVTEPDPREDLGGRDVMRKLLILGRAAGWPMEEEDVRVESIVPTALAHLDVLEFMAASIALDPSIADRVNAAGAAGEVLRYVAELENGKGMVRLKPVPLESPLAALKYLSFRTARYQEPLLVASNTTGVDTTAAGILGDMVALIRDRTGYRSHRSGL